MNSMAENWRSAGVRRGDTLLVHSDIRRTLMTNKCTPKDVLDSLLEAIGSEGTLLLPLFNFGFCHGEPFDIRNTPSQMGSLTEAGRLYPGSVRSGHPVYSFCAIGWNAWLYSVDNRHGLGVGSPFDLLHTCDGRIAVIDLPDQHSMTFYHHVEDMMQAPYRYSKTFAGNYTDWDGVTSRREYEIYVRDLSRGIRTDLARAEMIAWGKGHYRGKRPHTGHGMRTVKARKLFSFAANIINNNFHFPHVRLHNEG